MPIIRSGVNQGLITWLVVHLCEGVAVSNSPFIDPALQSTYRKPVFQYFDPRPVTQDTVVEVLVHFNLSKLWFELSPRCALIRHNMIPPWYFEMLHDQQRNCKYKEAVQVRCFCA